eukprot:scaffold750_cov342-Pinguiococcus_pyrenoidosus.AAC.1
MSEEVSSHTCSQRQLLQAWAYRHRKAVQAFNVPPTPPSVAPEAAEVACWDSYLRWRRWDVPERLLGCDPCGWMGP